MSPHRVAGEVLDVAASLALFALMFEGAAWAYPLGAPTIRWVEWATLAAIVAMSVRPLRLAMRERERA